MNDNSPKTIDSIIDELDLFKLSESAAVELVLKELEKEEARREALKELASLKARIKELVIAARSQALSALK